MATDWTINGDVNLYTNSEVFRISGNPVLSTPLTGNTLVNPTIPALTGANNTLVGLGSGASFTSADYNSAVGINALDSLTTGAYNSCYGYLSGSNYTSSESNNICVGNIGVAGDNTTLRLGTALTKAYISGINSEATAAGSYLVSSDTTGKLGTAPSGNVNSASPIAFAAGTAIVSENLPLLFSSNSLGNTVCGIHTSDTGTYNSIFGNGSGAGITSGSYNTILGYEAAPNLTTGTQNIAIGNAAMQGAVTGSNNLGIGETTLNALTSGSNNLAIGQNALKFQVSNSNCTAVGFNALQGTSGTYNTALGANAGSVLGGPGSNNVHIANVGALGDANLIKIGAQGTQTAAFIAGVYQAPVAVGATLVAADYLGTLGGTPYSGGLTSLAPISFSAGTALMSETYNLLYSNVTAGNTNLASQSSNLGQLNTSMGTLCGKNLTSSNSNNAFFGWHTGGAVAGNNNTFLGSQTGANVTAVSNCIAIGTAAYNSASATGSYTIAIGASMPALTSGTANICMGNGTGAALTTGNYNVSIGQYDDSNLTTGGFNVALGYNSGSAITTGSSNISILNTGTSSDSGAIRIGTQGTQSSAFMAGIYGVTTTGAAIPVLVASTGQLGTVSSSIKYKENVIDLLDSDIIHQMRPVEFNYIGQDFRSVGLIAEEVEKIAPQYVHYRPDGEILTVDYTSLHTLMLMEIQKLKKKVDELTLLLQTSTLLAP